MKKHRFIYIYYLPVLVLLVSIGLFNTGCGILPKPDQFQLYKTSSAPIDGFILSDITMAKATKDNELLLLPNGMVSLKRPNITHSSFSAITSFSSGDGLRFYFRTDRRKYESEPGLVFEFTKNGSIVYDNGVKVAETDTIKAVPGKKDKIIILSDADYFQITVECDTVYKGRTKLVSSEFVLIESINSNALLSAIYYDNIYGFNRDELLEITEESYRTREQKIILK